MSPFNSDKQKAPPDLSPPRHIVRRVVNRRNAEEDGGPSAAVAAIDVCDQLYRDLSRWVGSNGCHGLFTRALAQARADYPLLETIHLRPHSQPYLEGVEETIVAHGAPATGEALESMLVGLIELLGRLIGDDMATKLIEGSFSEVARGDTGRTSKRAEA